MLKIIQSHDHLIFIMGSRILGKYGLYILRWGRGSLFNIKISSYQFRKSHCGEKMTSIMGFAILFRCHLCIGSRPCNSVWHHISQLSHHWFRQCLGAKLSPASVLIYCRSDLQEHISIWFVSKFKHFHVRKMHVKMSQYKDFQITSPSCPLVVDAQQ